MFSGFVSVYVHYIFKREKYLNLKNNKTKGENIKYGKKRKENT